MDTRIYCYFFKIKGFVGNLVKILYVLYMFSFTQEVCEWKL